ncbi:hypothetical protein HY640_02335 [Candidatus Woesearchaeota archaeon]|nr:hypothetical protein [Candidatus Woesearchaeota archaeon]
MNVKSFFGLFAVLVFSVALAASAYAVPVVIDRVEVNGDEVRVTDPNRLDLVRGQDLDVKVRLTSVGNGSNVEVHAFVSGFEFNRDRPISDVTPTFDVESNVSYVKRLRLRLSDLAEEDSYLLRILVSDRGGSELVQNYRIKVDVPRHNLAIRDVVLNPDAVVEAGRALLATVRVKNMGERDEDSVKVTASIPALGVSASDFIDELESDDSTTSEELYLRIPVCASAGDYDVKVDAEFNEGTDRVSTTKAIEVKESDACGEAVPDEKTVILVDKEPQRVVVGGAGAVYSISLRNMGRTSRTYTLGVEGVDWGSARFSPSNVVSVKSGEVKSVGLFVSANPGVTEGSRSFAVSVRDQAGNVLEQMVMAADVQGEKVQADEGMRKYLEIGLVVLVVILVVIALLFIASRMKGREEEEEEPETKTYY